MMEDVIAHRESAAVDGAALRTLFEAQQRRQQAARLERPTVRAERLGRLRAAVWRHREALQQAVHADFGKAATEVDVTELTPLLSEIKHAMDNVARWMAPRPARATAALVGTRSETYVEPKGVALIIAPWNYPVLLTLGPLVSALAAGCCTVIKPSEHTPHTTAVLQDLVAATFAADEVAVVEGDHRAAQALLKLPFGHVFFTGSPRVGREVMKAAARHLTSVTLELGGKSPAIVDATADVELAAQKLVQGKFLNAGQTCIAPDYVLVEASVHEALVEALRARIAQAYGPSEDARRRSPDFARIAHARHWARLVGMLQEAVEAGAEVAVGGAADARTRYLAPTVLTRVPAGTAVLEEEIFGPLLPVVAVASIDEALAEVRRRPPPLVLYLFTEQGATRRRVLRETSAGGTCINETLLHFMHPDLPFGGVGQSGMGKGHGYRGFLAFSNERAVLTQRLKRSPMELLLPPYSAQSARLAGWLLSYFRK